MNLVRAVLALVLAGFLALTAVALAEHGYLGFLELALANWATRLLTVDLVICLVLIAVWMVQDARQRGVAWWPFVLIGALFGSAGPLLYLLRRPSSLAGRGPA